MRSRSEESWLPLPTESSVHVIRSNEILDTYPVEEYEDEYAQRLGNVPYTTDFFSALGTMLARRMWNVAENHYKVIAVAADKCAVERSLRRRSSQW